MLKYDKIVKANLFLNKNEFCLLSIKGREKIPKKSTKMPHISLRGTSCKLLKSQKN